MYKHIAASLLALCTLSALALESRDIRTEGADNVSLTVELHDGKTLLSSSTITTQDGYTKSILVPLGRQGSQNDRNDLWYIMTPTVAGDGKINVEFSARKSEMKFETVADAGQTIKVPLQRDLAMRVRLSMQEGKFIELPFGPAAAAQGPRYKLKLVASKLQR